MNSKKNEAQALLWYLYQLKNFVPLFYDFMSVYRRLRARLNIKIVQKMGVLQGF